MLFQLSYIGTDEKGKLFVNGFSEKGWGENEGKIENEKNRKIETP